MATLKSNIPLIFGVITAPVSVVSATVRAESLNVICNQGHKPAKTKQDLFCPECDSRDRSAFVKGKAMGDTVIVIDEQQLAATEAPEVVKNTITLTCHPVDQLGETLPGEKAYFLKPGKGSEQAYALVLELIRSRSDVAFVTEFAVRTVASFFRLQVFGDALALIEVARPDTVAQAPALPSTAVDPKMLELGSEFVDKLTVDYDREVYRDRRAEVIQALLSDGDATAMLEAAQQVGSSPADLMAMLQAAVGTAA